MSAPPWPHFKAETHYSEDRLSDMLTVHTWHEGTVHYVETVVGDVGDVQFLMAALDESLVKLREMVS